MDIWYHRSNHLPLSVTDDFFNSQQSLSPKSLLQVGTRDLSVSVKINEQKYIVIELKELRTSVDHPLKSGIGCGLKVTFRVSFKAAIATVSDVDTDSEKPILNVFRPEFITGLDSEHQFTCLTLLIKRQDLTDVLDFCETSYQYLYRKGTLWDVSHLDGCSCHRNDSPHSTRQHL